MTTTMYLYMGIVVLLTACVISLVEINKMEHKCKKLRGQIIERDQIIRDYVEQQRDRQVYRVVNIIICFFKRFFEEMEEDAKQALDIIAMKYKNKMLISSDGTIQCPAYLMLFNRIAELDPVNFSRIERFHEFLKKVYAYSYPQCGHEQPSEYMSRMNRSLLRHNLEAHEEELEKM